VTAWRYLVLESDVAEAGQWLNLLVQLPLPIAAIYTSAEEHPCAGAGGRRSRRRPGTG